MMYLLGPIKFLVFGVLILEFLLHHEIAKFFLRGEKKRLRYYLKSIYFHSRLGLWLLGVKVDLHMLGSPRQKRLLVANHVSYVDVLVLFAHYPSLFITSVEIRDTFLLGHLTKLAGCFFVERRRSHRTPGTVARELEEMKAKLNEGFDVFLFPEGTSTDGKSILPFKTPFFQMAIDCDVPVQPVLIKYSEEDLKAVAWYGDMTFPDHLFRLCLKRSVSVSLSELTAVKAGPGIDRVNLSLLSHARIHEAFIAD